MIQDSLFRILQIIMKNFSKMPAKILIEKYLRLKIVYSISSEGIDKIFNDANITPGAISVFKSRSRDQRLPNYSCIIIDHPNLQRLGANILKQISSCLIIDAEYNQINNILYSYSEEECQKHFTKAIVFKSVRQDLECLMNELDSYLSICQLFHGHVHAIVNCFQYWPGFQLKEHLFPLEGDEFEGIVQEGYFRILQERGSKITLEELSETCQIQRTQWGHIFKFEGGYDGLVVWQTQKYFPILGSSPNILLPFGKSKNFSLFQSSSMGYKIFKNKACLKGKIQELNFTTIIFNFQTWSESYEKQLKYKFDEISSSFFSQIKKNSEMHLMQQNLKYAERICSILQISTQKLLNKILLS